MNKDRFLKNIKQRLNDKTKQEHLDSIKYLKEYQESNQEEKEIKKLNKELKKNIILNEEI